jgi:hypothetical protein
MQVLKGDGYDVVGGKELDGAAKGTGAQLDSNDGFKTVAKELSISAFVTGEVSKKKAKLTIRNGSDGSVLGEGAFGGANPNKIAADVRDGFSRRLGSAVERGHAPSGAKKPTAAPAPEPEETEEKPQVASSGDEEAPAKPASKPAAPAAVAANTDETPPPSSSSSSAGGPDETVARKAPAPPPAPEGELGPRALDLSIAFGGFSRNLSYNQDIYQSLRQYKLALGPTATLAAVIYPAAFATGGFVANLGAEVNLEQTFGVSSSVPANMSGPFPNGATFNTVIHDYYGGVRGRLMFGPHEIALFAGGGEHAFSFRNGPALTDDRGQLDIPDTIYQYARVGLDTRFELPSGMTAGLRAAYRYVINQGGQIATGPIVDDKNNTAFNSSGQAAGMGFFPYLNVGGVDLNAMLGYHVTPSIEARFNVNLRRYFYTMNSSSKVCASGCDFAMNPAGQTVQVNGIAGGAVDQYIGFNVSVAYLFGGVAAAPPSAGEIEPNPEAAAPKETPKAKAKGKKKSGDEDDEDDSDQ